SPLGGALLPGPAGRKPLGPYGAGVSADRFSPENERGGTMPPAVSSVNANLSRPASRSLPADGISSQLLDALVETIAQLRQVLHLHRVVQPLRSQLVVLRLDHCQFEVFIAQLRLKPLAYPLDALDPVRVGLRFLGGFFQAHGRPFLFDLVNAG